MSMLPAAAGLSPAAGEALCSLGAQRKEAKGKWLGNPRWSRNPGSRFPFSGNCDLALLLVAFTGFRNQPVHHRSVVNYDQLQNRFLVPILAIVTAFTVHICHFWVGTLVVVLKRGSKGTPALFVSN